MLTPPTKRLLEFVVKYYDENGFAPTYMEMGEAVGNKSKSDTARLLGQLEHRGYIRRDHRTARGIQILRRPPGGDEWFDISTAPKDNREILAGFWTDEETTGAPPEWIVHLVTAGRHEFHSETVGFSRSVAPFTDWRPLPAPPAREQANA